VELCRAYALAGEPELAMEWIMRIKEKWHTVPEHVRPYAAGCVKEALELLGISADEGEE
jgi:hypothetical protein